MHYVPHTEADKRSMLATIGAPSVDALFESCIPPDCRYQGALPVEPALTEDAILRELRGLADKNVSAVDHPSFLGAGLYRHMCPALVDNLQQRTEFWTAYTPYQPEASQGTLTTIFEWQTMMCRLTGLEVSNASLYDGATALTEAVLMALRLKEAEGRTAVVVSRGVHPDYRGTLATYLRTLGMQLVEVELADGATDPAAFAAVLASKKVSPDKVAAVAVQQPNFFGVLEDVKQLADAAHGLGALCVVAANPVALSLVEAPGKQRADMVCGEATSMGNKPWFGGPGVGYLCSRMDFVRQMPARIAGETRDGQGRRAFVLTFATREQHIRRAKATSNICTSQQLMALRATIWMSLLGKEGFVELGRTNLSRAHYAAQRIAAIPGWSITWPKRAFFNEFTVTCPLPAAKVNQQLLKKHGILGGLDLGRVDKSLASQWLVAVTDMNTREEIDRLVAALESIR
ncbi:MAG TPA: aminomethyl-transferring glycine dehydrogenase subunit GcvPA [Planctomycetota bacterium]|nr:aminomethyl-transferring glycine dehydrogenase subunit GcvPA [Planctomycetota bacterium]